MIKKANEYRKISRRTLWHHFQWVLFLSRTAGCSIGVQALLVSLKETVKHLPVRLIHKGQLHGQTYIKDGSSKVELKYISTKGGSV